MHQPRLIHPVNITVVPWSIAQTHYDEDIGEPISQAKYLSEITLPGQVKWSRKDTTTFVFNGMDLKSIGYVLFRYLDLNAVGWTPKRQDKIIKMGHVELKVYIGSFEDIGHYPHTNGAAFTKAYFTDMYPGKAE